MTDCRVLLLRQRFCDCVVAYPFFFLRRKKNSEKERPLRGLRREVSPDLLRRTEIKLKSGAQCGSAPPGERVRPVAAATERLCIAEKVSVFGAKNVCLRSARYDSAALT